MLPRGIRNNNPLNIRIGNRWIGEVIHPTDSQFEQFIAMRYGFRAGFVLLRRYIVRYKLNTVRLIISRWAPSTENKTEDIIGRVSKFMAIDPDDVLSYENKSQMCKLVQGMCLVECGHKYGHLICMDEILQGYELAKN